MYQIIPNCRVLLLLYDILHALSAGILLGFSIAAPPGPVNAAAAYQVSSKRKWFTGFSVGCGAMTADGIFLLLTYLGWTSIVSRIAHVTIWIYLIGGLMMTSFGVLSLRVFVKDSSNSSSTVLNPSKVRSNTPKKWSNFPYILGLSLGLVNPFQIAWWLTVGLAAISTFGMLVALGFFIGITFWNSMYATALKLGLAKFEKFETVVLVSSILVLLGFGAWFLYNGLYQLASY